MGEPVEQVKRIGLTLRAVEEALRASWSRDTSVDPEGWSLANPAWGQCAVTALVIQDFFGGHLLRSEMARTSHYWNRLSSGEEVDLTIEQFGHASRRGLAEERTREYALSFPGTVTRYRLLRRRVSEVLD